MDRSSYNFIFLLEETINDSSYNVCLNRFTTNKTLIVSDFRDESIPSSFRKFLVSRNEDRLELIKLMDSYSNKIVIIKSNDHLFKAVSYFACTVLNLDKTICDNDNNISMEYSCKWKHHFRWCFNIRSLGSGANIVIIKRN